MKNRILGYDLAKILAIFFVVFLHSTFYTAYYARGTIGHLVPVACIVCVPLFFTVNGALLLPRTLDLNKHYRRFLTIFLTVEAWKIIHIIYFSFIPYAQFGLKHIANFLLGGNLGNTPCGHFWFMHALLAVYLVWPVIKLVFDHPDRRYLWILLGILLVMSTGKDTLSGIVDLISAFTGHNFSEPLGTVSEYFIFGKYGYVLIYFILGGLIAQKMINKTENTVKWPFVRFSRVPAGIVILLCYLATFIFQRFNYHLKGVLLTVPAGYSILPTVVATGLLTMLFLTVKSSNRRINRLVQSVGENTLGIYMLHVIILTGLALLQKNPTVAAPFRYFPEGFPNLVLNIVLVVLVLLICLIIALIGRRIPVVKRLFAL